MRKIVLKGCCASRGVAEGEALVFQEPLSFAVINPETGDFIKGHKLEGENVAQKILVSPCCCGSTTNDVRMLVMKKYGVAPNAIINISAYPIAVVGAITSHIPMMYSLDKNLMENIETGDYLKVDADKGVVEILK